MGAEQRVGHPGQHAVILGPDGQSAGPAPMPRSEDGGDQDARAMIEQPARVMRIAMMIKQLLEEVRAAPLDEASRSRLRGIHDNSIKELERGLAPELRAELGRLSLPFTEDTIPSAAELRIAQAQLVGWLEGLFHGLQTALHAQQMAASTQLEQLRRGLPPGTSRQQGEGGPGPATGPYL